MNRRHFLKFLSVKFDINEERINDVFSQYFKLYHHNCCKDIVEEALEIYTTEEYNACKIFFEFLLKGSDE